MRIKESAIYNKEAVVYRYMYKFRPQTRSRITGLFGGLRKPTRYYCPYLAGVEGLDDEISLVKRAKILDSEIREQRQWLACFLFECVDECVFVLKIWLCEIILIGLMYK